MTEYQQGVQDERERCVTIVEAYCQSYLRIWEGIVGSDRAKATAWDMKQLILRLRDQSPEQHIPNEVAK